MQDQRITAIRSKGVIYKDFPKVGVDFFDTFPLVADASTLEMVTQLFAERLEGVEYDKIFMLESRGFIFAPLLSQRVKKPCYPVRKKGKLPGECVHVDYSLEYGKDSIELQKSTLTSGDRVVIVDDLLATGGTLNGAIQLLESQGAIVAQILLINRIKALNGLQKLKISPEKVYFMFDL